MFPPPLPDITLASTREPAETVGMNEKVKILIEEARKLSPAERVALIDELLTSLHQPDPALDALWAEEIEDRLAAFDRGEIAEHDAAETVARLRVG
jgi:hypothetical protein